MRPIAGQVFGRRLVSGVLAAVICCSYAPAQTTFRGITPGVSTKTQVASALGQPLRQLDPLSLQYPPQPGTGNIDVEYDDGSQVVERVEIHFAQPVARAALVEKILPKATPAGRNQDAQGRLLELFGEPYFAVLTYAGGQEGNGVASLGFHSRQMFSRVLARPSLATATPSLLVPPDSEFRVKLLSPISTQTNRKGDKISAQVLSPEAYLGGIMEGQIREAKSGGKVTGTSSLNFTFDQLHHAGKMLSVRSSVKSLANSAGKQDVDEEGRIIKKKNNLGKAAAVAGAGALVGGLLGGGRGAVIGAGVGAAASLVFIQVAAEGANVSFAPGSEFVLVVRDQRQEP